jgi:hypothetical protein
VAFPTRALMVMATLVFATQVSAAQDAERAYFRAVAGFFQVAEGELAILAHGGEIPAEELPVALFMARRGGVSPEAVIALRGSGRGWPELAQRFGVGANALHVPLGDGVAMGTLAPLYRRFSATPVDQWQTLILSDNEIVALVNVRVLAQALGVEPDQVAGRAGSAATFVEVFASFLR